MKLHFRRKHIPYFIIAFFGLVLFAMGISNHYLFKTVTHDYGNYNFAFWDYAHFRISNIPTFKGNFLQDHFSLTLMYFVPVYWLLNWLTHTYTLIIIQNSLILVAAWYSYKIIKLKTNNLWLGAGVALYYFLLLGRYTAFSADVNLAIISSCFIPIFIYYFLIKKYLLSSIILILSLLSRENIPLWFIFIFIVLIIDQRKEKRAVFYGLTGIVISIVYFILLFKVFIPSVETKNISYGLFNYAALGATPGEALTFIISHPAETIKLFFVNHLNKPVYDSVKAEFYWVYLISGGFILFLRPKYLIWFIPIVAQKVLNDNPTRWGIATYYSIEVVTLLPLSVFLTLSSLKSEQFQKSLTIIVCVAAVSMTIHKLDHVNRRIPWLLNTSKVKIYGKHFFEAPFDVKKVNKLLRQIPPKAKVSASNVLLPHLAQRQYIYFFPTVKDAEYIVLSVFDNHYLFNQTQNEKERNKYFSDPNWKIVAREFPVFLLKKIKTDSLSSNLPNSQLWGKTDTLFCNYEKTDSIKKQILFTNGEKAEKIELLTDEKWLSAAHSVKLSPEARYGSRIILNGVTQYDYLTISVWAFCKDEKQVHLVSDYGKDFHFHCNESDTISPFGWRKYVMGYWVPKSSDSSVCSMHIWNSGETLLFIDNLEIIKKKLSSDLSP